MTLLKSPCQETSYVLADFSLPAPQSNSGEHINKEQSISLLQDMFSWNRQSFILENDIEWWFSY